MEKRREGGMGGGGDSQRKEGPSKLVARPPSRPHISLPTLGLNFRCPSERASSLEREGVNLRSIREIDALHHPYCGLRGGSLLGRPTV